MLLPSLLCKTFRFQRCGKEFVVSSPKGSTTLSVPSGIRLDVDSVRRSPMLGTTRLLKLGQVRYAERWESWVERGKKFLVWCKAGSGPIIMVGT
jgi:hypothetical protein